MIVIGDAPFRNVAIVTSTVVSPAVLPVVTVAATLGDTVDTASAKYELSRSCTRTSYAAAVDDASCEIVTVTVDASYASPDVSVPTTSINSTGSTSSNEIVSGAVVACPWSTTQSISKESPATFGAASTTEKVTWTTMSSSPVVAKLFTIVPKSNVARSLTVSVSVSVSLSAAEPETAMLLPVMPPKLVTVALVTCILLPAAATGTSTIASRVNVPSRSVIVADTVADSPTARSSRAVSSPSLEFVSDVETSARTTSSGSDGVVVSMSASSESVLPALGAVRALTVPVLVTVAVSPTSSEST